MVHRSCPGAAARTALALQAQSVPVRLVVVDNGSSPADVGALRTAIPDAEIIEVGVNAGFGGAANIGLRRWLEQDGAGGEWVGVCSHDAVVDEACLERLLSAVAERPRSGLVCAEYGDGNGYGGQGDRARPAIHPWIGPHLAPSARRPGWEEADHPHGTLMLLRRACLEDVGLFDERYFAYCEEADLGMRARAAGWEVGIVWGAVVRNLVMTSEPGVPEYLMVRNSLHLVRTHFGRRHAAVLFAVYAALTIQGLLFPRRRSPYWHTRGRLRALADFLRGRTGLPPYSLRKSGLPPVTAIDAASRPPSSRS